MKISDKYNFSHETKKEICNYYIENKEELIYLFIGFLNNNSEIVLNKNKIEFEFLTSYIDIIKLFKSFFNEDELTILISNKKTLKYNVTKYKVIVSPNCEQTALMLSKLDANNIKTKKQKQAIMNGVFLSGGSISNPFKSNYHLEFRISNLELLEIIKNILTKFNVKFFETFHHKKHVIYIKKIQDISDVLKILNATNNMFLLEEYRIGKDYVNTWQRLNNLDVSNLSKAIRVNNEMNKIIVEIKKTREYYSLSDNLKKYCEIKLQNPTLTMSELVEVLNKSFPKPVTKSWINHTNIKLRKIYKKYN